MPATSSLRMSTFIVPLVDATVTVLNALRRRLTASISRAPDICVGKFRDWLGGGCLQWLGGTRALKLDLACDCVGAESGRAVTYSDALNLRRADRLAILNLHGAGNFVVRKVCDKVDQPF